ncbi:hypothetical protein MASR1M45_19400 [Candidatus Kapaibacterium sp.]
MICRFSFIINNIKDSFQFPKYNSVGELIPCIPACDWNANLYGYYEIVIPEKRSVENKDFDFRNLIGVKVENYVYYLDFKVRINEPNFIKIKTFDLIGNQVDNQIFKCHNGENELRVQSNLPTGVYIYTIEVNQKLIKSDKFLVQ